MVKKIEQVPLNREEDENPAHTSWLDGKCISLNEGTHMTYYCEHQTSSVSFEAPGSKEPVTKEICQATAVRVPNGSTSAVLLSLAPSSEAYEKILPQWVKDNLPRYRQELKGKVIEFDNSEVVNHFVVNGVKGWLNKNSRMALMNYLQIAVQRKISRTSIWIAGQEMTASCAAIMELLEKIELYAKSCYDTTSRALAEIDSMKTPEELIIFSKTFTEKYPAPQFFNLK